MPVIEVKWTSMIPLLIFIVQMGVLCAARRCYECSSSEGDNCLDGSPCQTDNSCYTTIIQGKVSKGCQGTRQDEKCEDYGGMTSCYCNRDMCNDALPTRCYQCENSHGLECVEKKTECMGAGCAYVMCTAIDEPNYGNTLSVSKCLPTKPTRSGCKNKTEREPESGQRAACTTCECTDDYCNAKPDASALKYHESLADGSAAITCANFLMYGLIMIVAAATF